MQSSLQVQSLLNWKESVRNFPTKPNETNHRIGIIKNITEPRLSSVEMILITSLCSRCFIAFLSRDKLWFWPCRLPCALSQPYMISSGCIPVYTVSTNLDQTLFKCVSEALIFKNCCHFCQPGKWTLNLEMLTGKTVMTSCWGLTNTPSCPVMPVKDEMRRVFH